MIVLRNFNHTKKKFQSKMFYILNSTDMTENTLNNQTENESFANLSIELLCVRLLS